MGGRNLKYILVAGPQASGKTTLIRELSREHPDAKVYEEIGAEVLREKGLKGGAFVSEEVEKEILERGFLRLKEISESEGIHIDETGIFNIAHARGLGYRDLADEYLNRYLDIMKRIPCEIRFLDIEPEVSWERRSGEYKKRGFSEEDLIKAKEKIEKAHKEFNWLYEKLKSLGFL